MTDDRTKLPPGIAEQSPESHGGFYLSPDSDSQHDAWGGDCDAWWAFVDRIRAEAAAEERQHIVRALMDEQMPMSPSAALDFIDRLRAGAPGSKP